jgi:hypothetical protein
LVEQESVFGLRNQRRRVAVDGADAADGLPRATLAGAELGLRPEANALESVVDADAVALATARATRRPLDAAALDAALARPTARGKPLVAAADLTTGSRSLVKIVEAPFAAPGPARTLTLVDTATHRVG